MTRPEYPRLGATPIWAHPIKLSDTPAEGRATAPILGERNAKVFRRLPGLFTQDMERLGAEGVIA